MSKLIGFTVAFLAAQSLGFAQTPVKRATPANPVAAAAAAVAPDLSPSATIRAGDTFEVSLGGVPAESGDGVNFNKPYTVGADGMLNVPYIGALRAAGLTQSQLEKAIERRLVEEKIFRWPTITINVPERARLITVGGQVRVPQRTYWSADMTLMSAINAAGGPADFAGDKIRLTRNQKVTVYSRKKLLKFPEQDPSLFPGDQIDVL